MRLQSRYSFIGCPACGKTFKFWDTFEEVPTGKVLTCPKCRCMFAFQASVPEDIDDTSYTADVNDPDAFDNFVKSMTTKQDVEESVEIDEDTTKILLESEEPVETVTADEENSSEDEQTTK